MIKNKGMSINSLILVVSGLLILVIALYTYVYILKGVYGQFEFRNGLTSLPFGSVFKSEAEIKVALLYSDNTEKWLPEGSTWTVDNVNSWKKVLTQYKLNYTVIHDSDIERGRQFGYNFLVLPGAKSLSDVEVNGIKQFIDKGGSVFATSGTASFSNDGKWRGWEFFSEVFGLKFTREIPKEERSRILTLCGGYPVTANVPTGFPLRIATWDLPISVQVLEPRTHQVSYWFNYRLDTALVVEGLMKSAGIAYGTYGAGRFVWMGFELNSVIGRQEDYVYFDRMLHNSVNWLLYRPIANVKDWPGNFQTAALFAPVIVEDPASIENLIPILSAKGVRACYFVDPDMAQNNPSLIRKLAQAGELGVVVDIGYLSSVNDTINKLNDFNTQFSKLKSAYDKVKAIANKDVYGLFPRFGLFDDRTITAAAQTGYKFILTDSISDRTIPKAVIKGKNPILIIAKTCRDDYEVIRDLGLVQPEFQIYTYNEDIEKTIFEGGLLTVTPHPGLQCLPENVGVMSALIDSLKRRQIWVTNPVDLYHWWTQRNKIEMRVDTRSATRVAVTLSNPGTDIISDFRIDVDLQLPVSNIVVSSEIIGTELPKFSYQKDTHILQLETKNLKSNESRIYLVDFQIAK